MKNLFLFFVLLLSPVIAHCQECVAKPVQFQNLEYPLFITDKDGVFTIINNALRNNVFSSDDNVAVENIKEALHNMHNDGVTFMTYEILNCSQNVLSLKFTFEGMGAYPSSWYRYFNFSLESGNVLTLDSFIQVSKRADFTNIIKEKLHQFVEDYRVSIEKDLAAGIIDSDSYSICMAHTKNDCAKLFNNNLLFKQGEIEIFADCEFPHFIQSFEPVINIKLTRKELAELMRKEFQYRN